ncbi:MAG: MCE family protein [Nitrospirae bacterium]|nr:MAG: MCE family protein [Nitrospirota bacterium]
MEPKVNYTLVGAFVLILTAALAGAVLWLGEGDYRKVYDRYYAYLGESVSGLSVNSPVKYRGVEVGRVKEIILSPDNPEEVRLTFDIARGTPVKEDTLAVLDTQGLTGLAIVNLTGGSKASPPLEAKPGYEYPVIKSGPSLLYRLDTAITRLLVDQSLTKFLANSTGLVQDARLFLGDDNRAAFAQALTDLSKVSHTLAQRTEQLDQGVASATETFRNLAKFSRTLDQDLPPIIARVGRSAGALETMSKELARTGTSVNALVADTKPTLEQFTGQTLGETALLVAELRQLTATLQRVASDLEREPNVLVFGRAPQPRGPGE